MKYFILLGFFIALFSSEQARAQDTDQKRVMQVTARAVVLDNLMLVTMRDFNIINPVAENNYLFISPKESADAGQFRISGSSNSYVRVTYVIYEEIEEAGGNGGVITARYVLSGMNVDNQFQSLLFAPTGEFNIQLGEDGQYFLWIGAELDLSFALPGEYFSEFTIEMEYT